MRGSALVVALPLAGLGAIVAAGFWGDSYDDAFITYRYARSWAERGELAYNPGERVLGTTAPGYALLLGALSRLTGLGVPTWGTLVSIVSIVAVALVVRRTLADSPALVRDGVPLLFGAAALTFRWNVEMLGAESFPVLALGVGACHVALRGRRPAGAGLLIAAAMICRADAALLAAVLGLALWAKERRPPWAFAVAGLLPFLLFLGYLHREFGTVMPGTLAVKQSESAIVLAGYTSQEWRWLRRTLPLPGGLALLALAGLGLAAASGARRALRLDVAAVAGAWLLAHEVAYRALGVPFAPWYHVPLVNALLLLAAAGAVAVASRVVRARAILQGAAALLLLAPVLGWGVAWLHGQYGSPPDPRWPGYAAAGRFVDSRGGASVAAVEIGFLGWTTRARVLDLAGLVSPDALTARLRGEIATLVARERPEYIVDATLFRILYLDPVLGDPRILADYREVASFPDGRHPDLRVRLLHRGP